MDLRSRPLNVARSLSILGTGAQPSFWECLPVLNSPVQLICGSKDTRYVQLALEMQCRLPICRVELIPGAGHRAQVDRPRKSAAKLLNSSHSIVRSAYKSENLDCNASTRGTSI